MTEKKEISSHLRRFREVADLTQNELADLIDVSRQSIIALESGKCIPSVSLALKISALFNMPVEFIFRYDKLVEIGDEDIDGGNVNESNASESDTTRDLLPWSPLREIMSMRETVDRFFDEPSAPTSTTLFHPHVGIRESERELIIEADIPGVKEEDIDVEIEQDKILIQGERKHREESMREEYFHLESSYGSFSRVISLPPYVDTENADAEIVDGMLTIRIPKVGEKKSKKLKLKTIVKKDE